MPEALFPTPWKMDKPPSIERFMATFPDDYQDTAGLRAGCGQRLPDVRDGDEPDTGDWSTSDRDLVRGGWRLILGRDREMPALARLVSWFGSEPGSLPRP